MRLFLLIFAPLAVSCAAPGAIALTPQSPVQNCLVEAGQNADARRACIGMFSRECIERNEVNQTTAGMVLCVESERLQWMNARAEQVGELRAQESPSQNALLTAALDEHARWAQAHCAYAASIYEGGHGRGCLRFSAYAMRSPNTPLSYLVVATKANAGTVDTRTSSGRYARRA